MNSLKKKQFPGENAPFTRYTAEMAGQQDQLSRMQAEIQTQIEDSIRVKRQVMVELAGPVARAAFLVARTLQSGFKVMICGNGGSAADAQHFAGEMVGRYKINGRTALPVMALTTDSTILTCVANDFSYEEIFSRQVEAFGQPGDLLLGISTSGRSPNIIRALKVARERGVATVALLGGDGGGCAGEADLPLVIPSRDTARIQECHITLIHAICHLVENEFKF